MCVSGPKDSRLTLQGEKIQVPEVHGSSSVIGFIACASAMCHLALFRPPSGTWSAGNRVNVQMLFYLLRIIMSFVSDSDFCVFSQYP